MNCVLELKNLGFVYGKGTPFEKRAVDNVSLTIKRGEFIGVIGHTGSGKSTLMQMLNGLMRPGEGQVLLDGRDKGDALDKAVRDAADFTGLKPALLDKSPFDLSGGEKRRAAIAGVIAMNPEVLVLDEPTAGLDPMGREVLLSQITRYHKECHNTVLLVSHSMEDIARVADRIIVMNKGKLAMFEPTKEVFRRGDELSRYGLKVPQITNIMQALRRRGFDVPEGVLTVDEAFDALLPLLQKEGKLW